MKKRKEKERKKNWGKISIVLGLNPVHWYIYIGILVTSTTTGPGGSVVSALASQEKGRWFNRNDLNFKY